MQITKLTIENYKSFQYPTTIEFPSPKDEKKIFLVGGMNGAGKTSLMEAINICLYGAKVDFIYKYINRKELAKDNAYVSVELSFLNDEDEEIVIKRSWSAGTVDKPKAKDLEEKLVVIKDGKRVSVQNKELWQDFINTTIPKSITQFFFFDGEKIQEIAADDHSEMRLKSSLEAALGLQYITRLSTDVTYLKTEERKNFIEISDEDIEFKESELKKEQAKIDKKIKEKDEFKEELEHFKSEYEETKKRFQAIFNSDPQSLQDIKAKEKKRVQSASRLGQIENQIKTILENFLPWAIAGELFDGIRKSIEELQEQKSSKALKEKSKDLALQIANAIDTPEPIFDIKLDDAKKEILISRIVKLFDNSSQSSSKVKLNLSDGDLIKVISKMEMVEQSEILTLSELLDEKESLEELIKELDNSGLGVASQNEKELFEELQQSMESYQTQIGRLSFKVNTLEDEIVFYQTKIKDVETELSKLYEKHDISSNKKEFIDECDAISRMLMSYVAKLRKNKIELLKDKTFEMYKMLSSKSGLIKELEIDPKTYEIIIRDRNHHEMKKSGLSAGEKEVFAVSLLWGLASTSQLDLPIIIDTPLSRLDSIHRDNIVNNYFPNAANQVIILSTDTEIDTNYYKSLEPYLCGAGKLEFSQINELSSFKDGYFWK